MSKATDIKITDFFNVFHVHDYEAGQILVRPNEDMEYVYFIKSGRVRQYDITASGNEVVVNTLKPGAYFSVTQALIDEVNPWFYETVEEAELHKAPVRDVLDFVESNNDVTYELLTRVSKGAHGLQRRMAHLMGGSARTRILFELITEFARFGEQSKQKRIEIDISEAELAKRCGLSREVVSKELKKLAEDGLIDKGYRKISTKSVPALRKKLGEKV